MEPTFENLLARYAWRPIPGCPGRYRRVAGGRDNDETLDDWLRARPEARRHCVDGAPDPVWVLPLAGGGGIIAYEKAGGQLVHTLGDAEGFARKLRQLGIDPKL